MFINKNEIEKLMKENSKLKLKIQKLTDEKNRTNSILSAKRERIEAEVKALNDEAQRNNDEVVEIIASINNKIKKNEAKIKLENEFYGKLINEEEV